MEITNVGSLRKFLKAGGAIYSTVAINGSRLNAPIVKKQFVAALESFNPTDAVTATVDGNMDIYIGQ